MSGVYIHIPFCRQACYYCNFHFSTSLQLKDDFIAALVNEIRLTSTKGMCADNKERCETIYFGGGTPSLLEAHELLVIMDALHTKFTIDKDAEITLEANPDDISSSKLKNWKNAGINRLSVGIQSFSEKELVWMNRVHSAKDSLFCLDQIMEAGIPNYSIDLIYGSPLLSNEEWEHTVKTVIEKKVPHISCYALTVEPKTALDKMIMQQKKDPVDPAIQAAQFLLLMDWMKAAGYEHYEISNFSKPGMRSKHNSSYWQGKNYHGFGPSAHAYDGTKRKWNIANNSLYIQSLKKNIIAYDEELLTPVQMLNEYIMTSIRTTEGLDLKKIYEAFGPKYSEKLRITCEKFMRNKQIDLVNDTLTLTREGKLFADGITADLFFD